MNIHSRGSRITYHQGPGASPVGEPMTVMSREIQRIVDTLDDSRLSTTMQVRAARHMLMQFTEMFTDASGDPYPLTEKVRAVSEEIYRQVAETEKNIDDYVTRASAAGLSDEDLDEIVYDICSEQATHINNSGLTTQIQEIVENGANGQLDALIAEREAESAPNPES